MPDSRLGGATLSLNTRGIDDYVGHDGERGKRRATTQLDGCTRRGVLWSHAGVLSLTNPSISLGTFSTNMNPLDPAATTGVDEAGRALHDVSWGQEYPVETVTFKHHTFRFYNRGELLSHFFPSAALRLESCILIRDEYRLAYEHFERLQVEAPSDDVPNFVLTGQPGIGAFFICCLVTKSAGCYVFSGKTTFIVYALLRRLHRCQPTVVQFTESHFVLFDETGAHRFPSSYAYCHKIPSGAWALADSGQMLVEPGSALFRDPVVLVQTTSPAARRWKEWTKQHSANLYLMQLWDPLEIEILLYVPSRVSSLRV
jgi:hypothetical protein